MTNYSNVSNLKGILHGIPKMGVTCCRRLLLFVVLLATACASQIDDSEEGPIDSMEDTDVIRQAIINGWPMDDAMSGIVALQYVRPSTNTWWTFCSGALVTNNKIVTAKHCIQDVLDELPGVGIYAKMDVQRKRLVDWMLHDDEDVAVAKLESPMWMWNWSWDHYTSNTPVEVYSGYVRPLYQGTNASLDDNLLACFGYGGSTSIQEPELKAALLRTTASTVPQLGLGPVSLHRTNNQLPQGRDSGMPCLAGVNMVESRLAVVQSGCLDANKCYGPGAESWLMWVFLGMLFL